MNKIKTVLLVAKYNDTLSYYDDWSDAFQNADQLDLLIIDANSKKYRTKEYYKKIEFAEFIILHHSILADTLSFITAFKNSLINRKGVLLTFIGNEVNLPKIQISEKIKELKEIAPEFIATQLLEEAGKWLYSECQNSTVISVPHALNPQVFRSEIDYTKRPIEIGCRTALYGHYIGDNDRNCIISYFKTLAHEKKLKSDLEWDPKQRFNRNDWAKFLNRCKATISTEAGSFYLEKDDVLMNKILFDMKKKGNFLSLPSESSWVTNVYRNIMPIKLRSIIRKSVSPIILSDENLANKNHFSEIFDKFFKERPKAPVYSKCISSRHFEAIGTKTLQILFPGRYNDILEPNVHYLELNRDFSNIDNILSTFQQPEKVKEIVEGAYRFAIGYHTHKHRISEILRLLGY